MNFVNLPYDVTLSPLNSTPQLYDSKNINTTSFQNAANINNIYRNNGLICQQQMCKSITGCDNIIDCQYHPDYDKISKFCGGIGTPVVNMDGGWWKLEPSNTQQLMISAAEKATGMSPLPTFYNTTGMY